MEFEVRYFGSFSGCNQIAISDVHKKFNVNGKIWLMFVFYPCSLRQEVRKESAYRRQHVVSTWQRKYTSLQSTDSTQDRNLLLNKRVKTAILHCCHSSMPLFMPLG